MTANELKERREGLGKSAPEMARALKTPPSTYWKWENNKRRVPGIVGVAIDGLEFMNANRIKRG